MLNLSNPSGRTQPLTEISTGNINKNNVSGAGNLTAIYEPIV
jgi:hypothetical protein